jgi:ferritin
MSEDEAVAGAIEERLKAIEEELRRLTELASEEKDAERRQQYWDLARDVQAEARKVRMILAQMPPTCDEGQGESILRQVLKAFGMRMDATAMQRRSPSFR